MGKATQLTDTADRLVLSQRFGQVAKHWLSEAHALGFTQLRKIEPFTVYSFEGPLADADRAQLEAALVDRIANEHHWNPPVTPGELEIEVAPRAGVTDPTGEELQKTAGRLGLEPRQAGSGTLFRILAEPALSEHDLARLVGQLLANPTIHRWAPGRLQPRFQPAGAHAATIEQVEILDCSPEELVATASRLRSALDREEMLAIQAYFRAQRRNPTDGEFETIAQTWSEHCVHKTFKARISHRRDGGPVEELDGLLKPFLQVPTQHLNRPWVLSAFLDNAGILDFDDEHEVSIKVETHNHPSAIEPFGGANTGVGGVVRDVLGVSARPIALTDVLCFGPLDTRELPPGVLPPRRIYSGVIAGIQDYGNKLGVPVVNGAVHFDPGYLANPLVYCGCVGIAPKGLHRRQPRPGDLVVVAGGRTGRDGLRGATFSSMTMEATTGEVAGASVQIGDPIVEKGLIEVVTAARDQGLYTAITDCGAGGLSSAIGEMAHQGGGAQVQLQRVTLKYSGLAPWEVWLSEAQERMVFAIPAANLDKFAAICADHEVEWQELGTFSDSGRLQVSYAGQPLVDLDLQFLFEGIPRRVLSSTFCSRPVPQSDNADLLSLLADPNLNSKESVFRRYDHEVLGQTVVRPWCGPQADGPTDAAVIKPLGTRGLRGLVVGCGLQPRIGKYDAYQMALAAVDEAIRNAVACGGDPDRVALLDNFCWGDPRRPETLGELVEACRGCRDAALHYGAPFVSGKDSLNNEYVGPDGQRRAIPGTLLITALTLIEDVTKAVTSNPKAAGETVVLVGDLGHGFALAPYALNLYRQLHQAMQAGLVQSCHDVAEGGIAVAAAEMCIAGRIGMTLEVAEPFRESNSCLLLTTTRWPALQARLQGLPHQVLGTTGGDMLQVNAQISFGIERLVAAWKGVQ
jgi:phosphoribosylformylglycinamidine synthase subunit PurSL